MLLCFFPGIHTHCHCLIPCSTDELLHYELQQLLRSAEEAVGVQELVDVAFHSGISAMKSVEINSEKKKKKDTMNATSPWSNSSIGKKLNDCPRTVSCEIVEEG